MDEQLAQALAITGVGLTAVFVVLSTMALVIGLMSRLDLAAANRAASKRADAEPAAPEPTIDNLTLVLITAATATLLKGRFHIRKVRRLRHAAASNGSWSHQGRAELQGSHVILKKTEGTNR